MCEYVCACACACVCVCVSVCVSVCVCACACACGCASACACACACASDFCKTADEKEFPDTWSSICCSIHVCNNKLPRTALHRQTKRNVSLGVMCEGTLQ